jgi:excisionase family DNA binding protein
MGRIGQKMPKLLTIRDVAAALGLSESTIWKWRASRQIGTIKIGGAVRIAQSEIDRILTEGTVPAAVPEAPAAPEGSGK